MRQGDGDGAAEEDVRVADGGVGDGREDERVELMDGKGMQYSIWSPLLAIDFNKIG